MIQLEFINLTTIEILMTFENIMTFNCRKKAHVNTACTSFLSTAYFSRYKGVTGSVLLTYLCTSHISYKRAQSTFSARASITCRLARRKAPSAICEHAWAGKQGHVCPGQLSSLCSLGRVWLGMAWVS